MNCLLQTFSGNEENTAGVLCQKVGSSAGSQTARPLGFAKVLVLVEALWSGLWHARL
jgi:hypothetical protein